MVILTPFRNPSNNCLEFWSKNFGKILQTAVYLYRRVFRGETGICRKTFHFFWLSDFRHTRTDVWWKRNSARLSKLTLMCTESLFEGKNISSKTKLFKIFLGSAIEVVRICRKLLTRLSEPHSTCTDDLFVVNQVSVKKFFNHFPSKVRKLLISRKNWSALFSKLNFASPEDHFDMFS